MADGVASGTRSFFPGRRGFASAVLAVLVAAGPAAAFEPAAYGELLAKHVRPGRIGDVDLNVVDYAALAADPLYQRALAEFARADPAAFGGRDERLAFWINAYNLLAIRVVVDHYPVDGIRDVGNLLWPVWKRTAGVAAGRERTLDEIEHRILRPVFREPRVHFAIVCASVSCPDLRAEPYVAARLDAQLDEAARRFLANRAKGLASPAAGGRTISVSSIFRWFADDFAAGGGVLAFVRANVGPETVPLLTGFTDDDLRWLDYDWSLNDAARAR